MEKNEILPAVGLVLKEKLVEVNDLIKDQSHKAKTANAVMEAGLMKRLTETRQLVLDIQADFITLELFVREHQTDEDPLEPRVKVMEDTAAAMVDMVSGLSEKSTMEQGEHLSELMAEFRKEFNTLAMNYKTEMTGDLLGKLKGEVGDTGPQGEPGLDGLDAGAKSASKWTPGGEAKDTELFTHRGGLWKCNGATYSEPDVDDVRWVLLANGIADTQVELGLDMATLNITMADGKRTRLQVDIPHPNHTDKVWTEDGVFHFRDVVFKDSHSFIAQVDNPQGSPGTSPDWAKFNMRGKAGRKGDRGPQGTQGTPGRDGVHGPTQQDVERIVKAVLQPGDNGPAFRSWRGLWRNDENYSNGDVVGIGRGVYIAVEGSQGIPPASHMNAGQYWSVVVPPSGVGLGGGSGGGDLSAYQLKSEKGHNNGYTPLDSNSKVPVIHLPPSVSAPHHIFATQADMLAGGAAISAGEMVLVHGDPDVNKSGEYVALQDNPTLINHYDHLGEHVPAHRHTADDVDLTAHGGASIHLQKFHDDQYQESDAPDNALSAGDLRALIIGNTYKFPTHPEALNPGSPTTIDVSNTEHASILHRGHRLVNAVLIRTGSHTWIVEAEEFTGTDIQPTVLWYLDLDPVFSDHTGIGAQGATSFTSVVDEVRNDIGDSNRFGALSLVEKIVANEAAHGELSKRIATLEGGVAQQHTDIVQNFKLQINNQGLHYMIVNDRPTNPDHIGQDLFDGNEHKVLLEWDTASPYSVGTPFDPAHVVDGGNTANWVTGTKPNVWIQKGTAFKQLVDPKSSQVLAYQTIHDFIEAGSILTVKWNDTLTRLEVNKVEVASVHVVTSPDHQPLQVGGSVDAKSVPFVSLNATQQAAVKFNSIWMDETQKLRFRDNTGADLYITTSATP